jgi:hypothetical protein
MPEHRMLRRLFLFTVLASAAAAAEPEGSLEVN